MSNDEQTTPVEPPKTKRLARERILPFAKFLSANERIFNVLSTTVTAIFTVVLATSTVFLWKETKDLRNFAQEQGEDMKASIAEAARAATAMQNVATAVAASAKVSEDSLALYKDANVRQIRAYLTLGFGSVIEQNAATGYRYEVRMTLQNVGITPAYNVAINTHVAVLPWPLPDDFKFPDFDASKSNGSVMGPHQNNIITGIAEKIYSDDDVREITSGPSKRLYVYGTVKYQDAFGVDRQTTFCQAILWPDLNT